MASLVMVVSGANVWTMKNAIWLERIMNAKSKNLKGVEEYLI
jgi:hypothetical protein